MINRILQIFRHRKQVREHNALTELKARYHAFRIFLENNGRALELIVTIDSLVNRGEEADIRAATDELLGVTGELVDGLNLLSGDGHAGLYAMHGHMAAEVMQQLAILAENPAIRALCPALDDLETGAHIQVGMKAANLARLRRLGLPVPGGFVCTTRACKLFVASGELGAKIRQVLHDVEYGQTDVHQAAGRIRDWIFHAPLPRELTEALTEAYRRLETAEGNKPLAISVRSSGVSEDGLEHSFAGQFTSLLNIIGVEELFKAYREVIASGFSARALSYRLNAGLALDEFDFAVLCQVMADADCAGVLFTRDPSEPESGRMLISAVPGLGTMAVEGAAAADLYRPYRVRRDDDPLPPVAPGHQGVTPNNAASRAAQLMDGAEISHKTFQEVPAATGGLAVEPFPSHAADTPLLPIAILEELVGFGEMIESLEGMGQDVEWAYSTTSGIAILQMRPLLLAASKGRRLQMPVTAAPIVTGTCAVRGKAVGKVRKIHSAAELMQIGAALADEVSQAPCILVLPQSIVDSAHILQSCDGLVIEVGNPTDHLSCIAREYGVPMITGAQTALSCLQDGQWVIVDADHAVVLDAPESLQATVVQAHAEQMLARRKAAWSGPLQVQHTIVPPERQALRKMIVPLNLTDAYGPTFSRMECRSIHDIIRYTHEKAVLAMFDAGDMIMEEAGGLLRPLNIGVPFSFLVIDVGGGIRRENKPSLLQRLAVQHPLSKGDILSVPLAALCEGLTTPGLSWHSGPDAGALPGIMSKALLDTRGARPAGSFNYALAARDYLNLNARVEFHFAMLDAVCGKDTHANYIRFRFKGGGAGLERGHRRAQFLRQVLESNAFYTTVAGDLITASLTGAAKEVIWERLVMIGRLLGFSRFLDGVMTSDETPRQLAKAFLAGRYDTRVAPEEVEEGPAANRP